MKQIKIKFGTIVKLIKKQSNRYLFSDIPVGTKCVVIREVDLPSYDLLVAFDYELPEEEIREIQGNYIVIGKTRQNTMYLERGTWKLLK